MPSTKLPVVYIMASRRNGTLYVGTTSKLVSRVWQHRNDVLDGFVRQYRIHKLVYYEAHRHMPAALVREKQIKEWKRAWKVALIERDNPGWVDLYEEVLRRGGTEY
jgi:putative endonuclease